MKALLSQWIGTGTSKQGQLSAQHSGSAEKIQGSGEAEQQPFLGFMMNFLGMGAKAQTPEKTTSSLTGEASSENSGQQLVQTNGSQSAGQQLAADMMTTEAKIESKKVTAAGKEQAKADAAGNAAQKAQTEDTAKKLDAGSALTNSQAVITGEIPNENTNLDNAAPLANDSSKKSVQPLESVIQGSVAESVKGKKAAQDTAKAASGKSAQVEGKSVLNNQSNAGVSSAVMNAKGEALGVEQKPATASSKSQPTSENNKAAVVQSDNVGEGSKKSVLNKLGSDAQFKQSLQKQISHKGAPKDNSKSVVEEFKNLQKQGETKNGKAGERTPLKNAKGNRPADHQTMSRSAQNSNASSLKIDSNTAKTMPGKFVFSQSTNTVDIEMDMDTPQEFKGGAESTFKEIKINDLKSAQLGEAAGRKSFSRQLAQASRPQQSQQSQSSSQENTQWKHHRFMLDDGKSIHVAARNIEGALQLQLNAGKGELGKMLHQHLQDIQQHVQEELNITIDLQLQDFSGGQSNQQSETSSGNDRQTRDGGLGDGSSILHTTQSDGSRNVRYFGFNNNEWTA